jgi:hypothetical protein
MEIDGRHCETEESQIRKANQIASRRLLAKLKEVHGRSAPTPEPDVMDIIPVVVRRAPVAETKAEVRFLRYLTDGAGKKIPTVQEIKHVVAEHFKVTTINLDAKSRKHSFVLPRQIAIYLCSQLTVRSLPDIARRFGGRDHTTAIHSRDKIEDLIATDPAMARTVEILKEQLQ